MYCINCGKEVVNNYKFCIYCGHEIVNSKNNISNNAEKKNISNKKNNKDEEQIVYINDEPVNSIMENNVVVPLIFGILLATILSIVCIASLNEKSEQVLKYNTCIVEKL